MINRVLVLALLTTSGCAFGDDGWAEMGTNERGDHLTFQQVRQLGSGHPTVWVRSTYAQARDGFVSATAMWRLNCAAKTVTILAGALVRDNGERELLSDALPPEPAAPGSAGARFLEALCSIRPPL